VRSQKRTEKAQAQECRKTLVEVAANRGNGRRVQMRKLAVFVMIPALVMLTAALGAAGNADWGAIQRTNGLYAVTGFTTCLPAGSSGIFEADYTFNGDGTGSVTNGFVRNITPSGAGFVTYTVDFTYEVTHDGRITFEYPWGGNHVVKKDAQGNTLWELIWDRGPGHGVISSDGKTITVTCGPPVVLTVLESTNSGVPKGATNSCVTTGVGVRLH
jgi:hypothetical protein